MEFGGLTAHEVYPGVVAAVLAQGERRSPRGQVTRDLGYVSLVIQDPTQSLLMGTRPKLSTRVACVEALQLIGEFSSPELTVTASQNFERFREEHGGHFHGAYGLRIRGQIGQVVRKLNDDYESRQAVATIWDPFMDNQREKRDYPCTVMLQFEIRNAKLCMNTVMRSNDVHLGLPYDLFQFSQLLCSVANALSIKPGTYRHTALSMHAYERDVEALEAVNYGNQDTEAYQPHGIGFKGTRWPVIVQRAKDLAGDRIIEEHLTQSERWYAVRAHTLVDEMQARRRLTNGIPTP